VIYAIVSMHFKEIMLNERSQFSEVIYCVLYIRPSGKKKSNEDKSMITIFLIKTVQGRLLGNCSTT
jgi:hypothetical protein